ncbi:MAG: DUF3109 family protein [Bacteroidia bacterium]|nr:DUF3109 family protein [Bacteroidia bacterium]
MLQIGNTIISLDILRKKFICDIQQCKSACCIEGDTGAPLTDEEVEIISNNLPVILAYMGLEGIQTVEQKGFFMLDSENEKVTSLVNNKECVFLVFENNVGQCTIELAYNDKKTCFQKPLSCHLFPMRVKEYKNFRAINLIERDICKGAFISGEKRGMPVYRFLEMALIRKFGKEWYDELCYAAENLDL